MNKTKVGRSPKKAIETTEAKVDPPASGVEVPTKATMIIGLLKEPRGGTLKAIMAATGWQPHSIRGFISAQLVKKRKLKVKSFKRNGERVYKIPR
jgi:hypothetical protein